ncbi:hypothetical protein BKA65DRAFT_515780, partial [Rhexocercosporidium sp. MPI-PUGE-AT-0058]
MEDFNLPSTERTNLLKNLQKAMSDALVLSYFWAMCQIARISPLIFRSFITQAYSMRQKTTKSPASSPLAKKQTTTKSLVGSLLLHRSKAASDLAKERDGYYCVLSKNSSINTANIYLFCRLSTSKENEAELFPRGLFKIEDERVDNRITLSKPISISEDKTILRNLNQNEGAIDHGQTKLYNKANEGDLRIKSGDIFDLKTDDSIKKPLLSFKLLELQWFLTRVIGMAGAAFPYEAGSGDDSDEDWRFPSTLPEVWARYVDANSDTPPSYTAAQTLLTSAVRQRDV